MATQSRLMPASPQTAVWAAEQEEKKRIHELWETGELFEILKREKEDYKRRRREALRRMRPFITDPEGRKYYCIRELAKLRETGLDAARDWAIRRPSLCVKWNGHLYCRHEEAPPEGVRPYIEVNGKVYVSMAELGRRHGTTTSSARGWALRRPELVVRHDGWLYCRDEGHIPRKAPTSIRREEMEYCTPDEMARRHGVGIKTVRAWVRRHPEVVKIVRGRTFLQDDGVAPSRVDRVVWEDEVAYYCIGELARRRGCRTRTAWAWAKAHPKLTKRVEGRLYCRDEGWVRQGRRESWKRGMPAGAG